MVFTGECGIGLARIGARPHIEKIVPNPSHGVVEVTVDLDLDATLEAKLVRAE